MVLLDLGIGCFRQAGADIDYGIGDYAQADPALHTFDALIATAIQAMTSFEHTDSSFATSAPLQSLFEPALLLPLAACRVLGAVAGNRYLLNAHLLGLLFVGGREKAGIGGYQRRGTSQDPLVLSYGRQQ